MIFTVLKVALCLRKYVPRITDKPRMKTEELKIIADGPIPRSLM